MKKPSKPTFQQKREQHDKALRRVKMLEQRFPAITKITQHPKYKYWVPPFFAVIEVAGTLLFVFLILPFLLSLLPDVNVPAPNINVPNINLPRLPLPDINLPDLPKWLEEIVYWGAKTSPIWIALFFAFYEIRKRNKSEK